MLPNNTSNLGQTAQPTSNGEERIDVRGTPLPVTRISRRALLLAGVFGASLGLVVLMLGFGDHSAPRKDGPADENAIRPSGPIESVKDLPQDYSFDVNRLGTGYDGLSGLPAASNPSSGTVRPGSGSRPGDARARRTTAKDAGTAAEGTTSGPRFAAAVWWGQVNFVINNICGDDIGSSDDADDSDARPRCQSHWDDGRGTMGAGGGDQNVSGPDGGPSGGSIQNHQQEKEAFLTQGAAVEPYLSKPLLNPISKYELKAGSVIPGALVTAINTDLPGEVIGQVTENVYDTVTGNYLLIPQGSKLLGKYQSLVTNGQNRALVVWQRLIYPNGNSIVLDGMPGTDEAGQAGLQDKVDYHLDKLAEATALTTALAYGGNLARNPNSSSGNNGQDVVGDTVAQQANRIGEKVIDRELDVQPTITIRQGWPLRVLVNKDMILEPYVP